MVAPIAPSPLPEIPELRRAAQQLVASAFVVPLLEQMREDPFKSELFHGGFAEDAFSQQLDTILSDRIAQRQNLPLADAVYRHIAAQASRRIALPEQATGLKVDLRG